MEAANASKFSEGRVAGQSPEPIEFTLGKHGCFKTTSATNNERCNAPASQMSIENDPANEKLVIRLSDGQHRGGQRAIGGRD